MNNLKYIIVAILTISFFNSCVEDDDFGIPNVVCVDPGLTANKTVEEVFNATTSDATQYTADDIIEAYVTSSDQGGNFFKNLHLQTLDGSRGFVVSVDVEDLYTIYNPGRKVYVNLKDTYTQIDFDALEIGALFEGSVGRISANDSESVLIKSCDEVDEDQLVNQISISDINDSHLNTLVEFTSAQFQEGAAGNTFYDENNDLGGATNYLIQDLSGASVIFRTSSFANFASSVVPDGSGTIRGVLTKFRNDYQLLARTVSDLSLDGPRVRIGFTVSVAGTKVSIADARAKYTGADTVVADEEFIEGVITMSGIDENNISNRNAFVQDDTGGIAIRLSAAGSMVSGDQVKISLKDVLLSEFNGLLQVNVTQNEQIELVADGVALPDPQSISITELKTGNYESQLVSITAAQFDNAVGTYSGSQNITDCTDTVSIFTSSNATFADDTYPEGNGTIVGIASEFNSPQLVLREAVSQLPDARCTVTTTLETIANIRALFSGSNVSITDALKIKGVVTSDLTTGSVTGRNLYLQDGTAGIVVRFEADHAFNLGDEIEVIVQNEELSEFNGLLQVSGQNSNATNLGAGTLPTPQVISISDLLTGNFESLLVQINDVQFDTENGTFSGSNTVTDCTDSFPIFTSGGATFADTTYPTGNGPIIGIATDFNGAQLTLRDADDAVGLTGTRCTSSGGGGTTTNAIFFSELADPNNNAAARYIEIYNAGTENIDLTGWMIRRYTNDNPNSTSSIDLTGSTINAGQAFVIAAQATAFETAFGFAPDLAASTGGPADSNGDDNLELVDPNGTVIDTFGVPGEDGSNTNHEFEDGRANRKASVTQGNATYTFAEWDIWNDTGDAGTTNEPQDAPGNFTPGVR